MIHLSSPYGNPVIPGLILFVGSFLAGCDSPNSQVTNSGDHSQVTVTPPLPSTSSGSVDGSNSIAPVTLSTGMRLKEIVRHLSEEIGPRNLAHYEQLNQAKSFIESRLESIGYKVDSQSFEVNGLECLNLMVELSGTKVPDEIIIVGAHYDSVSSIPGANDNGSGVAALLVIAEALKDLKPDRTLRLVFFTNEEPPYFQREDKMGSWVYARQCRKNQDNIVGVLSLETMGYYTEEPNSQNYPDLLRPFYPTTGNFIGLVGNPNSAGFQRRVFDRFKSHTEFPVETASLPAAIEGVGWSDHWSFWQEGYPGVMVTDTAPFRYPHYHQRTDTLDKITFDTFAQVVDALILAIKDLTKADLDLGTKAQNSDDE
jgi:hypothetical protein